MIAKLFEAGADVFRLNMSHLPRERLRERVEVIRAVEAKYKRPIAILADLQGPKLRVGMFDGDGAMLDDGPDLHPRRRQDARRREARSPAASGNPVVARARPHRPHRRRQAAAAGEEREEGHAADRRRGRRHASRTARASACPTR